MEATFKGNQILHFIPVGLVSTFPSEHTRSRNMEATFKGKHRTIVNPISNGYYVY